MVDKLYGNALPQNLDMKELNEFDEFTTKIMKQYIDKVCSEPTTYIRPRDKCHRLWRYNPPGLRFPIMYFDSFIPSFTNAFLYGLEFDFFIMQVLIIACLDRLSSLEENHIVSRIVLGVLIAHLIDGFLVLIR